MFDIGSPGILTHGRAELQRWRRRALTGLALGLAVIAAGAVGEGRSWSFWAIVLGLWLALVMGLRVGFVSWAIRSTRLP